MISFTAFQGGSEHSERYRPLWKHKLYLLLKRNQLFVRDH